MSNPPEVDYKAGYKKPPKATQFKPGQTGNPKGRPKGSVGFKTAFTKAMNEKFMGTEHGKKRWYTGIPASAPSTSLKCRA